jgi:hypothetical protein
MFFATKVDEKSVAVFLSVAGVGDDLQDSTNLRFLERFCLETGHNACYTSAVIACALALFPSNKLQVLVCVCGEWSRFPHGKPK